MIPELQVQNLDLTVAIAGNFADERNLRGVQASLQSQTVTDVVDGSRNQDAEVITAWIEENGVPPVNREQTSLPWEAFHHPPPIAKRLS